ncbi:MAG: hypothetical protein QQN63_09145 [Nitrosopumilus sp.]
MKPEDSMEADDVTDTVAQNELMNQRDIKAAQRSNAKSEELGLDDLALGNLTARVTKLGKEVLGDKPQSGQGFKDILGKIAEILPIKKIGQSVAATISNAFPDSDENARPIFPGENHAIVKLSNDKYGRANWTGPGTRVLDRLKRSQGGDPPRVPSDMVSKAHDIRYTLANSVHNVREADLKMLSSLKKLQQEGSDRNINIAPAMIGIRGKITLEDFGLLSRDQFVDVKQKHTPEDEKLLRDQLWELEQAGFGNRTKGAFTERLSGGQYGGGLDRMPLLTRSQVDPFPLPRPKVSKALARFGGQPRFLNAEPGTSSTQSLPGEWSSGRAVQLDRRPTIGDRRILPDSGVNTKAAFQNRLTNTVQTGSGQVPGQAPAPSSEMVNQVQQKTRQGKFDPKMSNRLTSERKINKQRGGGFPGVSPIQINVRPKLMVPIKKQFDRAKGFKPTTIPIAVPGKRLLKTMDRRVQKRKEMSGRGPLANQFKNISRAKRLKAVQKPLFLDESDHARLMANALLPIVRVN